jgi:hypothetical protein
MLIAGNVRRLLPHAQVFLEHKDYLDEVEHKEENAQRLLPHAQVFLV